eukprot:TRINITY_DN1515_c0_g2_i2.p1 TRINITY_DN1515_c0_g2~~TRINITY_DN1515_c0_g2_i2.p1  ORF type:complete len:776 (+),score=305.97 TRINITY_DN1515_c0_g2_i2:39-2330(+)
MDELEKQEAEDKERLEREWDDLKTHAFSALLEVVEGGYSRPFDNPTWMQYYTKVYNLCTHSKNGTGDSPKVQITGILYKRFGEVLTDYLKERRISTAQSGEMLLKDVVQKWKNHKLIVKWMQRLFGYLDRYYTKHNSCDHLTEYGLKCFFNVIYTSIKIDLRNAIFKLIQCERTGGSVDRGLLKDAIGLIVEMGMNSLNIYNTDFEKPFLKFTEDFYEREAAQWVAEDSATEYLKKAEQRLAEEAQRAAAYLHQNSEKFLTEAVENKLLADHQKTLLEMENSGFIALLRDQRLSDIKRTYQLFSRISKGIDPIARLMYEFVTNEGKQIVSKHSNSNDLCFKAYTNDLLELHCKYKKILAEQLDNNSTFQKAVKDAFEAFVNQQLQCNVKGAAPGTPPAKVYSSELIANYCDMLMKNVVEKIGEDELEDILEQVVAVFGYISDKDLFQEFYRKQLSKRLLMTTVNEDTERSLISKLKMRQGAPYTSKLEGMITDKNVSQDLQAKFKAYQAKHNISFGFEYTMQVLTMGCWPAFPMHTLKLPEQVEVAMSKFQEFYDSITQSRKLRWVHSLSTVTLDAVFNKQKFQLQLSTAFQACVLLLFNTRDALTGEEITKELSLPWEEVKKALQSLAMGKYRLLVKDVPAGSKALKTVEEGDTFRVNVSFTDKSRKLKISTVVAKVNLKASAQVQQTVEEDRRHAIEACIVRIMKSRKTMEHPLLIGECISQLSAHFKPDPRHIKKRIEDLISREYIERDPEKTSLYRYVA